MKRFIYLKGDETLQKKGEQLGFFKGNSSVQWRSSFSLIATRLVFLGYKNFQEEIKAVISSKFKILKDTYKRIGNGSAKRCLEPAPLWVKR